MENLIDEKKIITLFEQMLKIRLTEETIANRYSEWKMRCPTHLSVGQEAVAGGVCTALRKDDFVMSTHRSHAHYLAKGGDLNSMIAELYGKETGCTLGKGGSMHLIDKNVGFMGSTSIVGSTIPIAVGLGLSIKLWKTDQVSCVFFGDAAVEEGVFFESVNFAVLKKLPILFICENNLYSVYSPLEVRQPAGREIFQMVKGIGIKSKLGDGNDILEVYSMISDAITKLRAGEGPQFFEFKTYRWREHCGPFYDNNIGYRSEDEFQNWKEKDPIIRLEKYLVNNLILNKDDIIKIYESIQSNVDQAFIFAENSPFPEPTTVFQQLFAD